MKIKNIFKKAVAEIKARQEYIAGDKGKLEETYRVVKNATPKSKRGKAGRIAALGVIDLAWFLFCLTKYTAKDLNTIFLDNKIIDSFKEKNEKVKIDYNDKKFQQFFQKFKKKYPTASARLKLWLIYTVLVTMVTGGVKLSNKDKEDNSEKIKKEMLSDDKEKDTDNVLELTTEDLSNNNLQKDVTNVSKKTYNVSDNKFAEKFVNENWNDIVISLCEFETWRDTPKLHSGESRYTYAAGLTWVYTKEKNKKGELVEVQHECNGKYKTKAANFTMEQKWNQVKRHALYPGECMSQMKKQLEKYGFKKITDQQALALFVAGYQVPSSYKDKYNSKGKLLNNGGIIHKLKDAGSNEQKQIDAFICGEDIPEGYREGTNKRRWWCAMLYTGKITSGDLLDMDRDVFSKIDINTILKKGHFVSDDATIEYAVNLKNSKGSVKDFIAKNNLIKLNTGKTENKKLTRNVSAGNASMVLVLEGMKAYTNKDYNKAVGCYENAIKLDSNNMEAYSSLALVYKKLADETHSLSDYEKSLDVIKKCNVRMNKNKDLLYDADVKAATYYNAGLVREEMAKIYEQKNNKEEADANYRKAINNFRTAYENAKQIENYERMEIYQKAQKRIETKVGLLKKSDNTKADRLKKGNMKAKQKKAQNMGKTVNKNNRVRSGC